ncbi:unnamed protein product [Spirodela intermedia]|uniref:Uncharacterized protein n=1 Tax=Spirodela intermedia TaxID=51605 RepID=A0A7I8J2N2_SPIIN|nr:unnamed protein product [Spirodela intermedia]CAA6664476.1 unnamed protein product [Spirodela intermedia]
MKKLIGFRFWSFGYSLTREKAHFYWYSPNCFLR